MGGIHVHTLERGTNRQDGDPGDEVVSLPSIPRMSSRIYIFPVVSHAVPGRVASRDAHEKPEL